MMLMPIRDEMMLMPIKDEMMLMPIRDEMMLMPIRDEMMLMPIRDEMMLMPIRDEMMLMLIRDEMMLMPIRDEMMLMLIRDEMMLMLNMAQYSIEIDFDRAFKSIFAINNFDGYEDYLVSDKLYSLIGAEMVEFRDELMKTTPPKTVRALMKTITPPKGVKRKMPSWNEQPADEGYDMFDGDGSDVEEPDNDGDESCESEEECEATPTNDGPPNQECEASTSSATDSLAVAEEIPISYVAMLKFAESSTDADIKKDAASLDSIIKAYHAYEYSDRMKCFSLQIHGTLRKARRNLKMRILNDKRRERESVQNAYRDEEGSTEEVEIEEETEDTQDANLPACQHTVADRFDENVFAECSMADEQSRDTEWLECPVQAMVP